MDGNFTTDFSLNELRKVSFQEFGLGSRLQKEFLASSIKTNIGVIGYVWFAKIWIWTIPIRLTFVFLCAGHHAMLGEGEPGEHESVQGGFTWSRNTESRSDAASLLQSARRRQPEIQADGTPEVSCFLRLSSSLESCTFPKSVGRHANSVMPSEW